MVLHNPLSQAEAVNQEQLLSNTSVDSVLPQQADISQKLPLASGLVIPATLDTSCFTPFARQQ